MNTSVEEMIGQYLSAWNENSLESYRKEFGKCWAPDAVYLDPYGEYKGLDGLSGFAHKSLDITPDRKFSIFEKPEHHHQSGRYAWKAEAGGLTSVGYDYFEFNDNFEITRLVSFFTLRTDYPVDKLN